MAVLWYLACSLMCDENPVAVTANRGQSYTSGMKSFRGWETAFDYQVDYQVEFSLIRRARFLVLLMIPGRNLNPRESIL